MCALSFPVVFKFIWYPFCWDSHFTSRHYQKHGALGWGQGTSTFYHITKLQTDVRVWNICRIESVNALLEYQNDIACAASSMQNVVIGFEKFAVVKQGCPDAPSLQVPLSFTCLTEVSVCFHAHLDTHSLHIRYNLKLTQSYSAKRINETYQM